ncbi:hypothetical protein [Cryobacterium sp.]|uniref:hypothetical protein n=1 Tax=Cryobacterium sp. TaxID=1926290 RepID=UPI00260A8AE4|nr:hypothetical protein [Cryobacterium sp.]MCU1445794.1 putative rane protein [Cryobacterium sp.]
MSTGLVTAAAVLFCVLMAGFALFQMALIAGAPLGRFAWGGQDRVLPVQKRVGSVISIGLYVVFGVVVLQRAGLAEVIPWPAALAVATWVLAGYFVLGVGLNALSKSRPERWTMAPLSAVLAALTIIVALS